MNQVFINFIKSKVDTAIIFAAQSANKTLITTILSCDDKATSEVAIFHVLFILCAMALVQNMKGTQQTIVSATVCSL